MTLPALLIEVESWVHFRQHFTHPNVAVGRSWAVRDPALDVTLFVVVLAQGCNLSLSTMADAASLPYYHLVHTANWYVREATIRQAVIALVDYHHSLPLAATFGSGTSAMSDGIRVGVTGNPPLVWFFRMRRALSYGMEHPEPQQIEVRPAIHDSVGKCAGPCVAQYA